MSPTLRLAEATGLVNVETLHRVTDVERAADGRWRVYVDRTDISGKILENKILTTDALVMAAGSMNTTKLLVRAGGNGADHGSAGRARRRVGDQCRSDLTSGRISPRTSVRRRAGRSSTAAGTGTTRIMRSPSFRRRSPPVAFDAHSTVMVGFGVSRDRGRFVYDSARGEAVLRWPKDGDSAIQQGHIGPAAQQIAAGGLLTDTNAILPSTWHPLGGACMNSVCDLDGRVLGQQGVVRARRRLCCRETPLRAIRR